MHKFVYWDVDTQFDFMSPEGRLYVPESEKLTKNLSRLLITSREKGIKVLGSVDYHDPADDELSGTPDFENTFPPHCLKGSPGQIKIDATHPVNPLWIDCLPYPAAELKNLILNHTGEIYFRKRKFDVFSNHNVIPVLDFIKPHNIILFGVALDVCNAFAIEGLLKMGRFHIFLVVDAVKSINVERGERLMKQWEKMGVTLIKTDKMVKELNHV